MIVFLLFSRSAENAGNIINTINGFGCFLYTGIDRKSRENQRKNVSEIDHGKSSKNDPKMDAKLEPETPQNRENRGPRCISISIVFYNRFFNAFFRFLSENVRFWVPNGDVKS